MTTYQQFFLDEEAEQALQAIMQMAKLSQSDALKQGLILLQKHLNINQTSAIKPFDIYKELDLGEGGYAIAPSSQAKEGVKAALQRKLQR
ncbi:hypothetical protein [Candidatus Marithrix sp. Canyon 246]|uniref:hypothetical protein n=1 Tax=Candidatus Marithrix sp. Canyon 246 TaxID=1827136 RepID=UPI00084A0CBB|nr:hypothetical protein [Candidatus Marithrix sp. Canyon 246]